MKILKNLLLISMCLFLVSHQVVAKKTDIKLYQAVFGAQYYILITKDNIKKVCKKTFNINKELIFNYINKHKTLTNKKYNEYETRLFIDSGADSIYIDNFGLFEQENKTYQIDTGQLSNYIDKNGLYVGSCP